VLRETKTLCAGCIRCSQKFSSCCRPPSRGRRMAKI